MGNGQDIQLSICSDGKFHNLRHVLALRRIAGNHSAFSAFMCNLLCYGVELLCITPGNYDFCPAHGVGYGNCPAQRPGCPGNNRYFVFDGKQVLYKFPLYVNHNQAPPFKLPDN